MKYQAKAQKICNEIKAYLIRDDTQISPTIQLKIDLLENLLLDYFNSDDYIRQNGFFQSYNKGTSFGLNPIVKLKYESIKQIRKILSEIIPKSEEITDNVESFIRSLTE